MSRPVLFVLAGVNGAGKSSVGGYVLSRQHGLAWFNPDDFAREWMSQCGCDQATANSVAWAEGLRRLDDALAAGRDYAFETTLGGRTIAGRLARAAATHDVHVWFCGLSSPEQHIARVRARVASGGHDIPDADIRRRYPQALANVIALMPHLAHLQVYDNSAEAATGEPVPDPVLVLEVVDGRAMFPDAHDAGGLRATPGWAKPLVEAALGM